MTVKARLTDLQRFEQLVALVGTVCRCMDCGRRGYLIEVGVQVEPRMRRRRYFAEWEHPETHDPACATICEWDWP